MDSGLTATLAGLNEQSWRDERSRMGHLLESFVVQQIVSQGGWTNAELEFYHYRDKVDVDLVITQGLQVWGIEVKASQKVSARDTIGLQRLADLCGKHFRGGVVLYNGNDTLRLGDKRFMAVPLRELWTQ